MGKVRASRLDPQVRREQLLACALEVVARRGIGRASHGEIARTAGVAVPTVFAYFKSRAELVRVVLEDVERFYTEMTDAHHRSSVPAPRAILDHAIAFAASVDSDPARARILLEWSTAVREEIWPLYLRFQESIVRRLQTTITRGQREGTIPGDLDPEDVAFLIVGSAQIVTQMKFTRRPPEKVHRFLLALLRGAIGADAVAAALG